MMTFDVRCPKCRKEVPVTLPCQGEHDVTCQTCDAPFSILYATARAKRSRGDKARNSREYRLRFTEDGAERFREFRSDRYHDAELRSSDEFLLIRLGNKERILRNLTVGQDWDLNAPDASPWIGLLFLAVLVVAGALIF